MTRFEYKLSCSHYVFIKKTKDTFCCNDIILSSVCQLQQSFNTYTKNTWVSLQTSPDNNNNMASNVWARLILRQALVEQTGWIVSI